MNFVEQPALRRARPASTRGRRARAPVQSPAVGIVPAGTPPQELQLSQPPHPSIEESMDEDTDCVVCTERMERLETTCNHWVHLRCIAMSGQDTCPACRAPVQFNAQDQELFYERRDANTRERIAREQEESLRLARQLQRRMRDGDDDEDGQEEPDVPAPGPLRRIIMLDVEGQRFEVRSVESDDGIQLDDYILQVNQMFHHVANRQRHFEADPRVVMMYSVIHKLNQISAETGLSINQLCDVIMNSQ